MSKGLRMSELMERYEREKMEKNLSEGRISIKQIVIFVLSFLFISSVLFIIYVMNHDIDIINVKKIAEYINENPPLFVGIIIFILMFLFTSLIPIEKNDMFDIFASLISSIIVSFVISAFFYFITYVFTFRWLV